MKILLSRNLFIFLAGILLIFISANSAAAQPNKAIATIRAEVAAVNKGASKYKKTTKTVESVSLEGTEATYFFAGEDLKKITAEIFGESFNATGEFYYRGGELIFAYIKHNKYDAPIGSPVKSPKVIRREDRRFYFADGELIQLLVGKKGLKSDSERYSELKDEVVRISKALKES